ncbi:centrosomal protein of 76 kDa-like [Macrobrachium nipponense]|uniref:centrosomal protein of 76 kDa-like n=1 Tax=Macrobrachium nipponense TaxID=159736 RepID=UPI0030C80236
MSSVEPKGPSSLEGAIKAEIEKENVRTAIDQVIREVISQDNGSLASVDPELIVSRLLDTETIQSLFCQRKVSSCLKLPAKTQEKILPGRRYLYVKVKGGRAFVDHVREETVKYRTENQSSLFIHLSLDGQRYASQGAQCVCEPKINEGFLFDLQKLKPGCSSMLDSKHLLTLDAPLNLVVVRKEGTSGIASTLLSVHAVDWRSILSQPSSSQKVSCQLMGVGSEQQVPVGLLDIEVTLIPNLEEILPHSTVSEFLEGTKKRFGERRRLFIAYARQWWQEFTEMAANHSSRPVKIFAMDEWGQNRFVCEFVRKLEVGRAVRSPEEAARWISLIPAPSPYQLPSGCSKPWYTHSTALVSQLEVENKCILLCSILLGFGLDAYVCVGTRKGGASHFWIMTRGPYTAITFWETVTGCRYIHKIGQKPVHEYETIGCVFNDSHFYASCQASNVIGYCTFLLEDTNSWKKMSSSAISSVIDKTLCYLPLNLSTIDGNKRSSDLEVQLKILIIEHRSDSGLSTKFDEHLSYVLMPALWSYERKMIYGSVSQDVGSPEHFSAALMHTVPEGYTFKAFPLHFIHNSPRRAFSSILSSGIGREIVECRGDSVTLAVRVITVSYPEDISVTWLMVACSFRPVG